MNNMKEVNEELDAMKKISEALGGKDKETCARIIDWAASVFTDAVLMHGCIRSRDLPAKRQQ